MFLCDRFNYEVKYLYTFGEVLDVLVDATASGSRNPIDVYAIQEILLGMGMLDANFSVNYYDLSFLSFDNNILVPTSLALTLIRKLDIRYKDHYCFSSPNDHTNVDECRKFMQKVFNLLDYTYDRYSTILGFYTDEKAHLLDRLSRTRSGTRDISSEGEHSDTTDNISIFNDTPQTTDVIATIQQNQYASELNKGQVANQGSNSSSGSDEFEENELFDTKTIMAKLDEVEKQYSNVIKKWLDEFDELFIEEVNY